MANPNNNFDDGDVSDNESEFNFPKDRERWTEIDLGEIWDATPPVKVGTGWDPDLIETGNIGYSIRKYERKFKKKIRKYPFYVPYYKDYPPVRDKEKYYDFSNEYFVVEELDRIEEALKWYSFVFEDGSTYEGTVWDDLAQGKGVFTTADCRYEGEWHNNLMQGHGVIEVDIPDYEPSPNSELTQEMREEGEILKADYMSPEDREWLIKGLDDDVESTDTDDTESIDSDDTGSICSDLFESQAWLEDFDELPETGHYRYAGQWKHSRMHGCGVYEVNRRQIWGKFYFGEMEDDPQECTAEISAMHASLAEVAAAKARMFVNKPDGMVREMKGPFNDPQHPYMYEEEDMWMAPGFVNQFYKVPELWKRYVHDVDQEREMWLNSFYKSPLRIPMPPELEYWWSNDPEFMVLPDTKGSEKAILLHVPTRRLIDWTEDPEGHVRLFWLSDGEDGSEYFLPLGYDEFLEEKKVHESEQDKLRRELGKKELAIKMREEKADGMKNKEDKKNKRMELEMQNVETEEKSEDVLDEVENLIIKKRMYEEPEELDVLDEVENQIDKKQLYEETEELKAQEKEHQDSPGPHDSEGGPYQEYEEVEEDEDGGDKKPRSFGTVAFAESQCYQRRSDAKTDKNGRSSLATPTVFASLSMVSKAVMHQLNPVASWLKSKHCMDFMVGSPCLESPGNAYGKTQNSTIVKVMDYPKSINYPLSRNKVVKLKAVKVDQKLGCRNTKSFFQYTQWGSSFHVLSHKCFPSPKLKKSDGRKKCQDEKREHQQSTKNSNKLWEMTHGIFSLSIPVEDIGC